MVPPLPLPLLVDGEDNIHSTNANTRSTVLVHTVCRVFKAHASLARPHPAGRTGRNNGKGDRSNVGKGDGGNNDGNADGSGQELDPALD